MSISLISNFSINLNAPIDDRIVATNSAARNSIQYLYDGLTVFQTDTRQSWTWNASAATWSYNVSGNGIYAGSGSVVGNTYVNLNSISTGAGANTTSNLLGYYSNLSGSSNVYYLNTFASKQSASPTSPLSFVIQNLSNSTNYSYIQFNPDNTDIGALSFGYNTTEYLRLANNGNLILKVGNLILQSPTYSATIYTNLLSSSNNYYLPSKSGTFALTSDINTLAATLSSISLQTVTNVGATTSRPVSVFATFSANTAILANNFTFTNNQFYDYIDSSNYIVFGHGSNFRFDSSTLGSGVSWNFFTFSIPSGINRFSIEVTFNNYMTLNYPSGRLTLTRTSQAHTKLVAAYKVSGTTITQIGTNTSIYSFIDGSDLSTPNISIITTPGQIMFQQGYNLLASSSASINARVFYRVFYCN